jgi:hypothetical protein
MNRVVIHQPEYLPCLALLAKIGLADTLILLDDAQFSRGGLQHRARIATPEGEGRWATIPYVHSHPQAIRDVKVDPAAQATWALSHRGMIETAYRDAPHRAGALSALTPFLTEARRRKCLYHSTSASMNALLGLFGEPGPGILRWASHLNVDPELRKSARVLALCEAVGATHYVTGRGGLNYLDAEAFRDAGITLEVSAFVAPAYARPGGVPLDAEELRRISGLDAAMYLADPRSLFAGHRAVPPEALAPLTPANPEAPSEDTP